MKKVKVFLTGGMMLFAMTGLAQSEKSSVPPPLVQVAPPDLPPPPPPPLAGLKRIKHPGRFTARLPNDFPPGHVQPPPIPPPPPPPAPPPPPVKVSE